MQNSDLQWRKRSTSVALSAFLLSHCTGFAWGQSAKGQSEKASDSAKTPSGAAKILVVGDSLSAEYGLKRGSGWVTLLQTELDAGKLDLSKAFAKVGHLNKFVIQNASISGETTAGGRSRLPELLSRYRPNIVIVELGGNDALRGLDLGMTENNLRDMTRQAQKIGAKVLLLGMQIPPNFGKAYAEKFSAIFTKVAQTEKAALVPFFLEGIADDLKYFQTDRIHPNETSQPRMMLNVLKGLKGLN
jgi:acyl-CoA thioesterase I